MIETEISMEEISKMYSSVTPGDIVLVYPPHSSQKPNTGIITRVGNDSVEAVFFQPDGSPVVRVSGIWNCNDPRAKNVGHEKNKLTPRHTFAVLFSPWKIAESTRELERFQSTVDELRKKIKALETAIEKLKGDK